MPLKLNTYLRTLLFKNKIFTADFHPGYIFILTRAIFKAELKPNTEILNTSDIDSKKKPLFKCN